MPKLKCIGGICDGELATVHDEYRVHDLVRVAAKIEFKVDTFNEDLAAFREGRAPKHFSIPYYMYKICTLHYKDINERELKIHYLIPQNWHEWEALKHLFISHQPYG